MPEPIILKRSDWKSLLPALKDNAKLSFISTAANPVQKSVLAAPLAVSSFIIRYAPQLCDLERIRILVIGAEWFDALDNGCWYQLISDFCGSSFRVEATLVGLNVFEESDRQTGLSTIVKKLYSEAMIIKSRLEDTKIDLSSFDLFVVFQPGFKLHQREWMKDALPLIVKTGKPIMATSIHWDEYAADVKYLEAFGYSVEGEPNENQFFLQHQGVVNGVSQWSKILYKITSALQLVD